MSEYTECMKLFPVGNGYAVVVNKITAIGPITGDDRSGYKFIIFMLGESEQQPWICSHASRTHLQDMKADLLYKLEQL